MSTSAILCILQWILLYYSSHLLSLKADECKWPQECGNLSFPYPFQVDQNTCGLPGFNITCKGKSKYNPGTPFLQTRCKEVQVLSISDDHILVDYSVLHASSSEHLVVNKTMDLFEEGPFRFSEFNKFFAVGCDTYGKLKLESGSKELGFTGNCKSSCLYHTKDSERLFCKGKGCCQLPIARGHTSISITTRFKYFCGKYNCNNSASALVDNDDWERISNSTTFKDSQNYSFRIDWAIPNVTCSSALGNASYQCCPSAECKDKEWGYICKCKNGYTGDGYTNGTGCREIEKSSSFSSSQALSMITGICGTLTAVLLSGGGLLWILKLRKSKRDKEKNFKRNGGDHSEKLKGVKLFSSNEMEKATKKFAQNLIQREGRYGTVYKGTLANGEVVTVKKPKEVDSKQIEQFINEVYILSQINHPNVVKLLGCCLESSVPLLVYEYISNRTLFDHLHGVNEKQQQLSWEQRLGIATGTAEALSHLHSPEMSMPIVHGDVKSSNILLDNDYNPKVADFGMSHLVPMGQTHVTTVVQGTMGYSDPEFAETFHLTEKSDVYSFGVILIELLTGLEPVSYEGKKNQSNLATFFLSTVNTRDPKEIIDPRLDVDEGRKLVSMKRLAKLAEECLNDAGEKRPSMEEVVKELSNDTEDNGDERVGLTADEEERSDGIKSA